MYFESFAILDVTCGVDDTVFLIGNKIPLDSKGKVVFFRSDGKIHHKYPFDGSKSTVNHYFTIISSSNLKSCLNCEFFGTWIVSFESPSGFLCALMSFDVIVEDFEKEKS